MFSDVLFHLKTISNHVTDITESFRDSLEELDLWENGWKGKIFIVWNMSEI